MLVSCAAAAGDVDYSKYTFNECAEDLQDCLASECCMSEGFSCFKRPHVKYAQCRKMAKGNCEDTDEWRCPGWADCPQDYESCCMPPTPLPQAGTRHCMLSLLSDVRRGGTDDAKCCKGHDVGCFKRPTRQFAQCRHFHGEKTDCQSNDDWLCPGEWEHCSPTMGKCLQSRCCDHSDHACAARSPVEPPPNQSPPVAGRAPR